MHNIKDFEIISIIFNKSYSVMFSEGTILVLNSEYLVSRRSEEVKNLNDFEEVDIENNQNLKIYKRKDAINSSITDVFFDSINEEKIDGNGSINISAVIGENGSGKSTLLNLFKQTTWKNQNGEKSPDITLIYRKGNDIKLTNDISEFKSYLDNFYFLSTSIGFSVNKNILDNRFSNRDTETGRAKFFFDIIKMGKPKELILNWLKQKNLKIELKLDSVGGDYDKNKFPDTLNVSDDYNRFILKDISRIKYLFPDKLKGRYLGGDLRNLSKLIGSDINKKYLFILSTNIPLILRCLEANYFDLIPINALYYAKKFAGIIGGDKLSYQGLEDDLFKMELGFGGDENDEYIRKKLGNNKIEIDRIHADLKNLLVKDISRYLGIEIASYQSVMSSLGHYFDRKNYNFIEIRENQKDLLNEEIEDFLINAYQSDLILFGEGKRIQFMNLSSGEQVLLIRFSNILNAIYTSWKDGSDTVILIDEPDLHLHLNWQREYILRLLQSLGREIKILGIHAHVIVATHSPFILSDISSRHCLVLGRKEGDSKSFQTFGANFFDIIEQGFFLDRTNGNFSHEVISYASKRVSILDTIKTLLGHNDKKLSHKQTNLIKGLFEEIGVNSDNSNFDTLLDSESKKIQVLLDHIEDSFIKSNIKYYD